ncbi:uncharacterized protein BXZ73DRAFT_91435 [Epithele typhae]|uniref:uncharacterized protein n=1 Tax=Epithele typhae TaxID=378194 RepID=UPI0020079323|nr:uncharacterized protein BXZ73DRAFT_91435 [Epithele typhae]KAH9923781.1 hypothetical protein BXZ73DRAFT_91435 [Epithele typhae]
MNFTLDDADPSFAYSSTGWAVQSPTDPDLDQFFEETYHVATANGASVSIQFSGLGFALFGSKGPQHAKFSVQFDETVVNLDASADETVFREELFAHTFSTTSAATHLVKITAIISGDNSQGKWFDLDYITFSSSAGTTTATIGTASSAPPWISETECALQTRTSTSTVRRGLNSSVAARSPSSKLPLVLAITFGALIGLFLLALVAYLLLRRAYNRRRERERAFRYGQSSVNPGYAPATSTAATATLISPGSGPSSGKSSSSLHSPSSKSPGVFDMFAAVVSPLSSTSAAGRARSPSHAGSLSVYSHVGSTATANAGKRGSGVEMRSMVPTSYSFDQSGRATPTGARPLLSGSPISWTPQRPKGHRGDADSLATDFLQV